MKRLMNAKYLVCLALVVLTAVEICSAGSVSEWKQRTIYQLMTDRYALGNGNRPGCNVANNDYCGGNFQGIINNLDYIKGMGFDAIWISPVVDNYPRGYHGYWARNINQINSNFGSADDLKALTQACHNKGIWVMVDVVANHMGNTNQNYNENVPFNNPSNYHDYCQVENCNPNDQSCLERCRLAGLADLKQEDSWVSQQLLDWIHNLVNNYGFDGIRIDTVPYVPKDFWRKFASSAGVFQLGEVFNGDMGYVSQYVGVLDSVFNYPAYFRMKDVFLRNTGMRAIETMYNDWSRHLGDISMLGLFSDNQDNPRFLSYCKKGSVTCLKLYKGWITFNLASVGIPVIYYGTEQQFSGGNDPYDREALWFSFNTQSDLYKYIQTINAARSSFKPYNYKQVQSYSDDQLYAFYRGQFWVGLSNVYDQQVVRTIITHPFSNGQTICNIFYPKDDCLIIKNGSFQIYLNYGESKIFVPKQSLEYLNFLDTLNQIQF